MAGAARSRSTWLTGAAGLLMLAVAFVMMFCAAPRIHPGRHGPAMSHAVSYDRLDSWVRAYQLTGAGRTPLP